MAEGVEVGRAYVAILPNATGFATGIQSAVVPAATATGKTAGKGMGGAILGGLKGIAGPIAALFAASAIADFFTDSINAASDLAESTNKVQQIFGSATGDIMAFAGQGAKSLGLTQLAARDAASTFGVFGKSAGLSGKDLSGFSIQMTTLATDLASFHNTSPEDAIQAIGAALRGETEPMRRYGVLLDDASMRQEAMRMGLIKTTKQALTPQQKVLAAQSLILKQTADAQGDFARTSDGLANQQRISAALWEDLKGKIGNAFLPAVTAVVTFVNSAVIPAISGFVDWLGTLGSAFDGMGSGPMSGFVAWIQGSLVPALNSFIPVIQQVIAQVVQFATDFYNAFVTRMQPMLPTIMSIFSTIGTIITTTLQLIAAVVGVVLNVIMWAWQNWGQSILNVVMTVWGALLGVIAPVMSIIQNLIGLVLNIIQGNWSGVWNNIVGILAGVWNTIVGVVQGALGILGAVLGLAWNVITSIIGQVWNWIAGFFVSIWNKITKAVSGAASSVVSALSRAWSSVVSAVTSTWNSVVSKISSAVSSFTKTISNGVNRVVDWFKALPGKVISAVGNLASRMASIGSDIVQGIWSGISNGYGWITGRIRSWIGNVVDFFKRVLHIGSPSKLMADEVGRWAGQGVVVGMEDQLDDAEDVAEAFSRALTPDLSMTPEVTLPSDLGKTSSVWAASANGGATITYGDITVELSMSELAQFKTLLEFLREIDRKAEQGVSR